MHAMQGHNRMVKFHAFEGDEINCNHLKATNRSKEHLMYGFFNYYLLCL